MTPTATRPARPSGFFRFWVLLSGLLLACTARLYAYDVTVAQDGTGNYTTIQAAVTAAPASRTTLYTIYIKDGICAEKVTVPGTKPFLQFVGQSVANTILTWNDNALTPNGSGGTVGTGGSGSLIVNATDFSGLNMTFVNSFGDGSQAVAVSLYADRAAFKNCRFLGNQDTLLTYKSGGAVSRHYFRDCYIDGNVDFIFGSAIAIFDNCVVYAKTRVVNPATSYITAANTPATQGYGYLFRRTRIPSNNGTTLYYLGRPWQNSTGFSTAAGTLANNKVVFSRTKIGVNQVQPAGWVTWDAGTDVSKITFGEFQAKYFNGNNVNVGARVSWSQQLTATDTLNNYTTSKLFGLNTGTATSTGAPVSAAWDPASVSADFSTFRPADIAVANLQATKGATQTSIQWNVSWAMPGIQYALQRSSDNITFATINTQTATTDSLYNFAATDVLPVAGTAYYYRVVAFKATLATHTTASIQVSSIPTITTSTTALPAFAQYSTGTSAVQTYTVSGANMTNDLTITPPAGFEVSANGGTSWYGSGTPLVLMPTANTIASTTISVRLNTATVGSYSGNITHTSLGATAVSVAVNGTRNAGAAPQSDPLIWWPLIRNANDSTAIRAAQLVATVPTFKALYLSNGTTLATIPAYSTKFGQAFGASSNGDGTWAAVGGTLKRNYYEQFTVTTTATGAVRLDSVVLAASFYNTSSNTKLAVVYSKSGFTTADSTDVSGGTGPGVTGAAYGAFGAPIGLANLTGGPTNVYHLALNGSTGVSLTAGQTLTFRVYFACGSSSAARYASLKNVVVKGAAVVACNAAFSYGAASFCSGATAGVTPTVTGTTGGAFSSTAGLIINATTGTIAPASSTAGTYTVTYTASPGCFSTQAVTIVSGPTAGFSYSSATICAGSAVTLLPTSAPGATKGTFTLPATTGLSIVGNTGAVTVGGNAAAGTYTVTNTLPAGGACGGASSTATFTITATPATPVLSMSGTPATGILLSSSATTGNQYYRNGVPVTGATAQTLLINSGTKNGTYSVAVTNAAGCSSNLSNSITVTVTATAGATAAGTSLSLYPNPTRDGLLTLELTGYSSPVQVRLLDALGRVVYEGTAAGNDLSRKQALDLHTLPTGVYLLQATSADGGTQTRRVVRE